MKAGGTAVCAMRVALLLMTGGAAAEPAPALRDPLQPPAAARPAPVAAGSAPAAAAAAPATLRQILVVDGRRYAVEGTRLRGVGARFGNGRIERIGDDAIWLREGGTLQRVPLFAGITRHAAAAPAEAASAPPASLPAARALARAHRSSAPDTP